MRTNPSNYYDLLTFGLGEDKHAWQQFVNRFQQKYNAPQTDGFAWDPEIQLDYTYEQLQTELGISTLPIYVDAEAEALDKKLGGFKVGSNRIPTQKHRYGLNTRILREKLLMIQKFGASAMNQEVKNAIMELLFDSTDKLLAGNQNALTHQRMQVVSTGKFTIAAENNPRGLQGITFDFGIVSEGANATTKRWWTAAEHTVAKEGSAADPIEDLKSVVRDKKKAGWPSLHIEMAKDLYDDMLTHTAVLKRIGYASNPLISADSAAASAAGNMLDEQKGNIIERLVGARIVAVDSKARVEKFDADAKALKFETIENFAPNAVAFVPDGPIGTIKSVQQLVMADDPTVRYAWFDGGRTLISQRYDAKTRATYVESEGAWLTVPNMPQYMTNKVVTA